MLQWHLRRAGVAAGSFRLSPVCFAQRPEHAGRAAAPANVPATNVFKRFLGVPESQNQNDEEKEAKEPARQDFAAITGAVVAVAALFLTFNSMYVVAPLREDITKLAVSNDTLGKSIVRQEATMLVVQDDIKKLIATSDMQTTELAGVKVDLTVAKLSMGYSFGLMLAVFLVQLVMGVTYIVSVMKSDNASRT